MKRAYRILEIILGVIVVIIIAYFVWWNVNPVLPGTPKFVRDWIAKQPKIVNDDQIASVFLGSTAYKCETQGTTYYTLTITGGSKHYLKDGTYLCDTMAKQRPPTGCPPYVSGSLRDCTIVWQSRTKK